MILRSLLATIVFSLGTFALAQDEPTTSPPVATESPAQDDASKAPESSATEQVKETAEKLAKTLDKDPRAKTAAAGVLQPIYVVAENLAFPTFHWLAFALMTAGVVSYALQLVLGKLVVLMRMGFSLGEIISDAFGLAISVIGLVLTTQAAAENSTFTQSAAAVLTATVAGAIVGLILYWWGQAQELQAAAGRSQVKPKV
ncbi:MAG: hypothetical protein AABP62_30225 [Planctomycetota bacterium]